MTDWDPTNQVRGDSLHRSNRSYLTGQTGLIRGWAKFLFHDSLQPTIDLEKAKTNAVVQIGDIKVAVDNVGKKPIVFGKSINSPFQRPIMTNYHKASSSNSTSKYFHPR